MSRSIPPIPQRVSCFASSPFGNLQKHFWVHLLVTCKQWVRRPLRAWANYAVRESEANAFMCDRLLAMVSAPSHDNLVKQLNALTQFRTGMRLLCSAWYYSFVWDDWQTSFVLFAIVLYCISITFKHVSWLIFSSFPLNFSRRKLWNDLYRLPYVLCNNMGCSSSTAISLVPFALPNYPWYYSWSVILVLVHLFNVGVIVAIVLVLPPLCFLALLL